MVYACILTFEKCRDFFENSNGKCANNPLFGWQPVHWLSESQCTHRVNALFTCWVNTLFTHGVEALFTRVVDALFTQVVKALFTQAVLAYRGKMTMKMPWNKPWFFAVFQNITRSGRKYRKNKGYIKSKMPQNDTFFLLSDKAKKRHDETSPLLLRPLPKLFWWQSKEPRPYVQPIRNKV